MAYCYLQCVGARATFLHSLSIPCFCIRFSTARRLVLTCITKIVVVLGYLSTLFQDAQLLHDISTARRLILKRAIVMALKEINVILTWPADVPTMLYKEWVHYFLARF